MKKSVILLVIFGMVIISLSACGKRVEKQYPWEIEGENMYSFSEDEVAISLENDTLTPTGASFLIKNIGNERITFDQAYTIQIEIDEKWYSIENIQDITLESISLMPDESISFVLDWTSTYGKLPSGKYRLIKAYSTESDSFYIFCEFLIS